MTSIEKQAMHSERFEWNKPYAGIKMLFGDTRQRLIEIDLTLPTIIWLDYDGTMSSSVISDIRHVAHAASHGSVLVVTVNAQPRQTGEEDSDLLDEIRGELGNEKIPADIESSSLFGWGLGKFYRRVGNSEIRDALSSANGVREEESRLSYEQLFHFHYEDGARMATFGGVFFENRKIGEFQDCAFDRLSFVCGGSEPFLIPTPKLTLREVLHLERQMPVADRSKIDYGQIPKKDADNYINLYRFFPAFLPVDLL